MPKKIRELKQSLSKAGFVLQKGRGKGSHSYWIHPAISSPLIMPGKDGDDAPRYLEQQINNTPDTFFNGSIRLSGLAFRGLSYFFKVSSTPDIELNTLIRTG
jgi:predicted RNA binding protein YcfA (HicA-like mRNA interferase family)